VGKFEPEGVTYQASKLTSSIHVCMMPGGFDLWRFVLEA